MTRYDRSWSTRKCLTTMKYEDGERVVRHYEGKAEQQRMVAELRGEDAERWLRSDTRTTQLFSILFSPLTAIYQVLLLVHRGIGWLMEKLWA